MGQRLTTEYLAFEKSRTIQYDNLYTEVRKSDLDEGVQVDLERILKIQILRERDKAMTEWIDMGHSAYVTGTAPDFGVEYMFDQFKQFKTWCSSVWQSARFGTEKS